jgi:hypothetical protein
MNDIRAALEQERLEQQAYLSSQYEHNEEEEHNQVLIGDISEQLVGDLIGQIMAAVKGPTKGRKKENEGSRRQISPTCPVSFSTCQVSLVEFSKGKCYNDICGCLVMSGEEEGSSWGTSLIDKSSYGDDNTSFDDSSETDSKIRSSTKTQKDLKAKSWNVDKKGKGARWKKLFKRGEKCEC